MNKALLFMAYGASSVATFLPLSAMVLKEMGSILDFSKKSKIRTHFF
jgi:hypothetical protein